MSPAAALFAPPAPTPIAGVDASMASATSDGAPATQDKASQDKDAFADMVEAAKSETPAPARSAAVKTAQKAQAGLFDGVQAETQVVLKTDAPVEQLEAAVETAPVAKASNSTGDAAVADDADPSADQSGASAAATVPFVSVQSPSAPTLTSTGDAAAVPAGAPQPTPQPAPEPTDAPGQDAPEPALAKAPDAPPPPSRPIDAPAAAASAIPDTEAAAEQVAAPPEPLAPALKEDARRSGDAEASPVIPPALDAKGSAASQTPCAPQAEQAPSAAAEPAVGGLVDGAPDPDAPVEAAQAPTPDTPAAGAATPAAAREAAQPQVNPATLASTLSRATVETTAQLSAHILRRLEGRSTRFDMVLTPEALGRVDVSVDIDSDGRLAARLAFDNPAAALDLRGRADELRRQLEDAGFRVSDDALSFTDRDSGRSNDQRQDGPSRRFASAARVVGEADQSASAGRWVSMNLTPDRVDVRV